jgi:hypothetical protein
LTKKIKKCLVHLYCMPFSAETLWSNLEAKNN